MSCDWLFILRWNLVYDERECHLSWLVILKSSSISTMGLTSKEERSQCHTLNHCWVVLSCKYTPTCTYYLMSSLFLLPPISFLAYKYYHYFGSSKGSKARGKHTLVSVVFMHQGVFNSVCPFNCLIPKTTMVGLPGRISRWGNSGNSNKAQANIKGSLGLTALRHL